MGLDGLLKNKDMKLSGVQNGGMELRGAEGYVGKFDQILCVKFLTIY